MRRTDVDIEQITERELVLQALGDPVLMQALREVDALTPEVPAFLPPEHAKTLTTIVTAPAYTPLGKLPKSWSFDSATEEAIAPNGIRISRAAVERHGWAWADIYANSPSTLILSMEDHK